MKRCCLSLCFVFVLCLSWLSPLSGAAESAPPHTPAQPDSTGMRYGAQVLGGAARNSGHLNALGLRWVKFQMSWKEVEANPGDYRWTWYDSMINGYSDAGFAVVVSVVKAPDWARPAGDNRGVEGPPEDPATLANFMSILLQRYCGRIRAIEVWNEQNLWYEGGGSAMPPPKYVTLLAASYQAIKAIDSKVIVISGAPTPTGANDGKIGIDDVSYLQQMYAAGLRNYSDAIGAHASGFNNPPDAVFGYTNPAEPTFKGHRSFFFRDTLEHYRNVMTANGDAAKQVWVTEFGWASNNSPLPGYEYAKDNTPEEQAQYIVTAYDMAKSWGWVGAMLLWNLDAGIISPGSELSYFSLLPAGPAYAAVASMPKTGQPAGGVVAGYARTAAGYGVAGVTVTASNGISTQSGLSGCYSLVNLPGGTYTVTPTQTGHEFGPASRAVTILPNTFSANFTQDLDTEPVSATIGAAGGALTKQGTGIDAIIVIPAEALTGSALITLQPQAKANAVGLAGGAAAFNLSASNSSGPLTGTRVLFTLQQTYSDSKIGAAKESTLAFYRKTASGWEKAESTLDTVNNVVTAQVDQFGVWALLGETKQLFLPATKR